MIAPMVPRKYALAAALALAGCGLCARAAGADSAAIVATMRRAADWELANPSSAPAAGWVQGAWYTGLSALNQNTGGAYHDALLKIAEGNGWKPAARTYSHSDQDDPYHADDICVAQTYLELYLKDRDPRMIAAIKARCDYVLAHPKDGNLEFVGPEKNDRWAWCDSLFMGPPTWIRLWAATGNQAYLDYMVAHWWETSAYLYDPAEHLFYRDSTYFKKKEKNGTKVFWSRGNGWVLAGLARVLDYLPKDHPDRPRFERQFRELAARVRELQQPDGFWRASLLDPASYPSKETSGTGFFCYGLAWGINHGLLASADYRPAVDKAWAALNSCLTPAGKLTYVQPIGAAPAPLSAESTEAYGVGAFLLAGCEISRF